MAADNAFLDLHPSDPIWGHGYARGANGVRIHFVEGPLPADLETQDAPPIILLHGWPGFWYDYRRLIPALAGTARLVAPDFRGFGDSDRPTLPPAEGYNVANHVADMLALLDDLGIEQAVFVGHDIGAVVAQALARQAPERVAALALFNPSYGGIGARRYEPRAQREFWYQYFHLQHWADEMVNYNRDMTRLYLAHFYDHWVGRKESVRGPEFEAIVDTFARPGAFLASIQWYRARVAARSAEAGADPASLRVTPPSYVAWGELDPVFPVAWSDRLPEYFADLRTFRTLPGVGHFVPFEAPEDALALIRAAAANPPWRRSDRQ